MANRKEALVLCTIAVMVILFAIAMHNRYEAHCLTMKERLYDATGVVYSNCEEAKKITTLIAKTPRGSIVSKIIDSDNAYIYIDNNKFLFHIDRNTFSGSDTSSLTLIESNVKYIENTEIEE